MCPLAIAEAKSGWEVVGRPERQLTGNMDSVARASLHCRVLHFLLLCADCNRRRPELSRVIPAGERATT